MSGVLPADSGGAYILEDVSGGVDTLTSSLLELEDASLAGEEAGRGKW